MTGAPDAATTDEAASNHSPDAGWTWGWPPRSRKAHAYNEARTETACGAVVLFGRGVPTLQEQNIGVERGPDDCARCFKKVRRDLDKLAAKTKQQEPTT